LLSDFLPSPLPVSFHPPLLVLSQSTMSCPVFLSSQPVLSSYPVQTRQFMPCPTVTSYHCLSCCPVNLSCPVSCPYACYIQLCHRCSSTTKTAPSEVINPTESKLFSTRTTSGAP
jgi:hypothetical protein